MFIHTSCCITTRERSIDLENIRPPAWGSPPEGQAKETSTMGAPLPEVAAKGASSRDSHVSATALPPLLRARVREWRVGPLEPKELRKVGNDIGL